MAKVSVIIPMYNAKKYILGCVDALLAQTIGDVEIIVVNDCSTDGSPELLRERYADEPRVVLLDQPRNMGPGEARNAGLLKATGEYLTFVDADDGILPEAFEEMYETAKRYDADVVHVGSALIPCADPMPDDLNTLKRSQLVRFFLDLGAKPYTETHLIPKDMKERIGKWTEHQYAWNVWEKLFRTDFIREHGLKFSHLPLSEDQNFCFSCLIRTDKYVIMPGNYYIYRIAGETISRGDKTPKYMAKVLRAYFGISAEMKKSMEGVPYFEEHPEEVLRVVDYCGELLTDNYIRQTYRKLGRDVLEADPEVCGVFESFFGSNGRLVSQILYDRLDTLPEAEDLLDQMNTTAFWENAVKAGMTTFLEEPE